MSDSRASAFGTIGDWVSRAEAHLSKRGVTEATANAQFLMAAALRAGRTEVELRRGEPMGRTQAKRFWRQVLRRGRRVPLAYVLGTQPFNGMELKVDPSVLIPRPETEELAAVAEGLGRRLSPLDRRPLSILDFGAGSGCIALYLAKVFPEAEIVALDISRKALANAAANAKRQGARSRIRFISSANRLEAGWRADLIVSNPPYIPTSRLKHLEREVKQEPQLALDGGPDGLTVIRQVIDLAVRRLAERGWLVLEMDSSHARRVEGLLKDSGFDQIEIRRDFQQLNRFAIAALGRNV